MIKTVTMRIKYIICIIISFIFLYSVFAYADYFPNVGKFLIDDNKVNIKIAWLYEPSFPENYSMEYELILYGECLMPYDGYELLFAERSILGSGLDNFTTTLVDGYEDCLLYLD